jgi:hypothetical protein
MEAATVARSPAAAAAAPAAPPAPKKRPRGRPEPGKKTSTRRRTTTARPKTASRTKAAAAAPARRAPAPSRRAPARRAPARKAPARRQAPSLRPAGQLIPIAFGTAARVRHLPDSPLMVRLTSGRAWIAVLGVLLVGIVGLNVLTLSIAAKAGQVDENRIALEKENGILGARDATLSGAATVRHAANQQGLAMADPDQVTPLQAAPDDAVVAAERLAGASGY